MVVISIIVSVLCLLFFPGFLLSFVFFKQGTIDAIERLVLSFAFSISVVPLVVFYTNLLGFPITVVTVGLQVGVIMLCGGIALGIQELRRKE